jgi:hypothetical protein
MPDHEGTPSERVRALLGARRDEVLRIAARHGAHDVRVFGSVPQGEDREDSDVDFLVRLDPGVTLLGHAALVRELEGLLGRKVDVVSEGALRPRLREEVLREAVPL